MKSARLGLGRPKTADRTGSVAPSPSFIWTGGALFGSAFPGYVARQMRRPLAVSPAVVQARLNNLQSLLMLTPNSAPGQHEARLAASIAYHAAALAKLLYGPRPEAVTSGPLPPQTRGALFHIGPVATSTGTMDDAIG